MPWRWTYHLTREPVPTANCANSAKDETTGFSPARATRKHWRFASRS